MCLHAQDNTGDKNKIHILYKDISVIKILGQKGTLRIGFHY